ncbi:hypothetical protein B296_00041109 [Ensete ventricosum]|uniref:Uncharacterized protein n=1 Tax=Ensete ventricosum TaxID=4639 RepID=A0A426ZEE7_ENSVE|nr:hypothetical protein B296_00041109 [Ensete ventricosum]
MLSLTSVVTSSVAATYGESVGVEVWRKGVARHMTFMMLDGSTDVVTFNAAGMLSQAKSTRSLGESKRPSLKRRLPYKSSFPDQVGMASSISFTTSEFTSRSSSDPSSQAEGCRPSNRVGSRLEALSSSSVILTQSDVKAIKAMEVMKSCHDFDSTISTESLVLIRRRFSIPDEYALHAPQPGQRSYHESPAD